MKAKTAMEMKREFLDTYRPKHGYTLKTTLVIEVSVSHSSLNPYTKEQILAIEQNITRYLKKP
mgnify:CR=1 FL=1